MSPVNDAYMHMGVGTSKGHGKPTSSQKWLSVFLASVKSFSAIRWSLRFLGSFTLGFIWLDFVLCWSCVGNHSCCEFVFATVMSYSEGNISQHSSPSPTLTSEGVSVVVDIYVTYRQQFTFAYSQPSERQCVSALLTTHCNKKLPRLEAAQIYGYKYL